MHHAFYMQLALDEAWKYQLLTYPNPAVGAVVVREGKILAIEAHKKAGTSHAEVLALTKAYEELNGTKVDFDPNDAKAAHIFLRNLPKGFFSECSIYVTLEPCSHQGKTPSCASLLKTLSLKEVIIGTKDPIEGHDNGAVGLNNVTLGILEEKCKNLLEPFLIWQKRAFVLFKLAQTTNARIGGGYLSSQTSLEHVHQIRAVCDTLLIGGNTVRTDRPRLDCRFTGAKAPDVIIYTQDQQLDKEIPLFKVDDRKVRQTDKLNFLDKPSLMLVEGGEGMLRALKEKIDWLLFYQTPKLTTNNLTYNTTMNLEFLHQENKDVDLMIWSRQLGN
jgi:diaminohydroxyphosphoribosylaminopyrimidine deaminase/5-amino-6-(5-phosphoribosylamino)uracil reductase